MKRKLFLSIVLCLSLVCVSAFTGCTNAVDEAKKFMDAGMYPQAIELLKKSISEKPDDGEAHFQLGVCYSNTGNFRGADERFASAVKLDSDFGFKIGGVYRTAGSDALNNGNSGQAIRLFQKAVQYQPDLKQSIAKDLLPAGKSYLDKQQSKKADSLLTMAVDYDPSLKEQIDAITLEYGKKLLAIAKEKPKSERKRYVDEALRFVSQKDVDAVLSPPVWKTVFKKTLTGEGYGYDDYIKKAPKSGVDIKYGDKIIIIGDKFSCLKSGWKEFTNRGEFTYKSRATSKVCGIMAPKGKKITVEVQRLETSY